jgi:hypothetical protein
MIRNISQFLWRWRVRAAEPASIRELRRKIEAARRDHKPTRDLYRRLNSIRHERLRT